MDVIVRVSMMQRSRTHGCVRVSSRLRHRRARRMKKSRSEWISLFPTAQELSWWAKSDIGQRAPANWY
jgi:hypothetical protein